MDTIFKYFVYLVVGMVPTAMTGVTFLEWEWWAVVTTLNVAIVMHDIGMSAKLTQTC